MAYDIFSVSAAGALGWVSVRGENAGWVFSSRDRHGWIASDGTVFGSTGVRGYVLSNGDVTRAGQLVGFVTRNGEIHERDLGRVGWLSDDGGRPSEGISLQLAAGAVLVFWNDIQPWRPQLTFRR
jgi:hypothetical protein